MKSGHLSSYDGHLGKLNNLGRTVRTLLKERREAKHPLLVGTVILVFQIFHEESGIVTF